LDELFPKPTRSKLLSETIEVEGAFREVRRPVRYKTRSRIDRKAILSHHHTRPLNSLRNVLGELSRVYRSVINGSISTIEGVRLSFILREVRGALEAVTAEEARIEATEAARAAAAVTIEQHKPITYNIIGVPRGCYATKEGIDAADLPSEAIEDEASAPPPPVREFEPQSAREMQLLAELERLTPEELLARAREAGFVDADGS
jgi:hypothetical protein